MNRWLLNALLLPASAKLASGQENGKSSWLMCPPIFDHTHDTDRRGGDPVNAINARHHPYSGNVLKVQLGYIDTTVATLKEILDNSWIGLVVVPESTYEVASFRLDVGPPDRDTKAVIVVGSKLTSVQPYYLLNCNIDYANLLLKECKPGYSMYFTDIRIKKIGGGTSTVPVKSFEIKITR